MEQWLLNFIHMEESIGIDTKQLNSIQKTDLKNESIIRQLFRFIDGQKGEPRSQGDVPILVLYTIKQMLLYKLRIVKNRDEWV